MDINQTWHNRTIEETLNNFGVNKTGLSNKEVEERQAKFGKNELTQTKRKSNFVVFLEQFKDVMIIVLLISALLAITFGIIEKIQNKPEWHVEIIEGLFIFIIVIINSTIGAVQEIKASNALDALRKIGAPMSRVIREGKTLVIATNELVVGDIVFIEDGAIIPADLRLIESQNLKIQEGSLTGESVPVEKNHLKILKENISIGDRSNMCFSSSIVTYGNGIGVVVSTGMNTEVGKIAKLLTDQKTEETPLKKKLNKIGKVLSIIGAITAFIILVIGFATLPEQEWKTFGWLEPLMLAVTLAVAVIPEGLPATATIVMSIGVQRMAKKNAIVKKLPTVETLGNTTVICSDKTGTLTLNKMTVCNVLTMEDINKQELVTLLYDVEHTQKYQDILLTGILCNNAQIEHNSNKTIGDPTEGAILLIAGEFNMDYQIVQKNYKKLSELPFDSIRKCMSVCYQNGDKKFLYTKGAAEDLIKKCKYVQIGKDITPITEKHINDVEQMVHTMSNKSLRVLGFAMTEVTQDKPNEENLVFIGLMGMIDPPRKEVIGAINTCHAAGIKTVMITGDHKITAKVIASQLGIYDENKGHIVITGEELEKMPEEELKQKISKATVFARISPELKLRIINAFKSCNEITAMTGDGVNDAPALKSADIGVAMGITGTDVAKDAADMILLDDNFTTIENAVLEGRRIFRNIQKVIQYLITGNIAEILAIILVFIGSVIYYGITKLHNFPGVLNPIQLLLINLFTETVPCIALGLDPPEVDIMTPTFNSKKGLFSKGLLRRTIWHGIYLSVISLIAYCVEVFAFNTQWMPNADGIPIHEMDVYHGEGATFLVIGISQSLHVFNLRSDKYSMFSNKNPRNILLILLSLASIAFIIMIALVSWITNTPEILGVPQLQAKEWLLIIGLSISIIPAVEIAKALKIN